MRSRRRSPPREWLAASAGESPDVTFSRFVATTAERFARDRARLAQGLRFDVRMPFGPMDWTVRVLHGFWDSWLHERDVLLARDIEHPADGDATVYATAYGLFIAVAVASIFGARVQEKLTLGGYGGGVFELDSSDGVTLTVTRVITAGPPAAQVTDALAGRAPSASVLGDLPADSRAALSGLGDFFNTPVEPSPTRYEPWVLPPLAGRRSTRSRSGSTRGEHAATAGNRPDHGRHLPPGGTAVSGELYFSRRARLASSRRSRQARLRRALPGRAGSRAVAMRSADLAARRPTETSDGCSAPARGR